MALSAVYEEWRFADSEVHVLSGTCYVSCFQLLFGFLLFPAQCHDGVPLGTATRAFVADAVGVATGQDSAARRCSRSTWRRRQFHPQHLVSLFSNLAAPR